MRKFFQLFTFIALVALVSSCNCKKKANTENSNAATTEEVVNSEAARVAEPAEAKTCAVDCAKACCAAEAKLCSSSCKKTADKKACASTCKKAEEAKSCAADCVKVCCSTKEATSQAAEATVPAVAENSVEVKETRVCKGKGCKSPCCAK